MYYLLPTIASYCLYRKYFYKKKILPTMEVKLSSARTISEADLATAVPNKINYVDKFILQVNSFDFFQVRFFSAESFLLNFKANYNNCIWTKKKLVILDLKMSEMFLIISAKRIVNINWKGKNYTTTYLNDLCFLRHDLIKKNQY